MNLTAAAIAALIALPAAILPMLERLACGKPNTSMLSRAAAVMRRQSPMLLLLTALLLSMIFESVVIDPWVTETTGFDFTPTVHAFEGDAAGWVQRAASSDVADLYFYITYMILFVVSFYGSVMYFAAADDGRIVQRLVLGYCLIFAVALPFFLFFPVNEVWTTNGAYAAYNAANGLPYYGLTDVRGVLYEMGAGNLDASFSFSSVDSCFPSLHTAISVFVPLVLISSREKVWGAFAAFVGFSVVLSTMYLGVHWISDVAAGLALAVAAWLVAMRLEVEVDYPFRLRSISLGRWKRTFGGGGDGSR
jgi:membrane-associated phospholipid phosphatase